ncbi:MAG TPA: ChbG/HpnK family deacetylase [Patescibacteria group bacterium]|nr:ChbG/HpnK family deacetylase [Patescibacteria group bacterium]
MNGKRKNLIISADDFGISKLADVNILRLVEKGKVDRVAVMMSPNLSEAEIERLKKSGVKIDIHLHLIREDSDYWLGNRLLKEGAAKRMIFFVFNYFTGRAGSEKIALKWAIQIEEFKEVFGRNPDGIGSHEYIHFFPPYFRAVLKLAEKYEIPYVRLGNKKYLCDNRVANVLNNLRKRNILSFGKSRVETSRYMISLDWAKDINNCWRLIPREGMTELVCHPEREEEFDFLDKNF